MADHAPSFRYHPTLAPKGTLFKTHAELDALDTSWVDTPAKFPKDEPVLTTTAGASAEPWSYTTKAFEPPKKRGRPRAVRP